MVDLNLWNTVRKSKKITLSKLAEMTEISLSTLKEIFRGATTDPRIETVQRIERALGIDKEQAIEMTEEEKQLATLIAELTDDEVKELSNYIDFIISKRK